MRERLNNLMNQGTIYNKTAIIVPESGEKYYGLIQQTVWKEYENAAGSWIVRQTPGSFRQTSDRS
jgi:hypothetical protein